MKRVQELITIINNWTNEDEPKSYVISPYVKELAIRLDKMEKADSFFEIYSLIANTYRRMGRFVLAAHYYEKALDIVILFYNKTFNDDCYIDRIKDLFYNILKYRNRFIDDDCKDVLNNVNNNHLLPKEMVDEVYKSVMNHRRDLKSDPIEMSEEYLNVIDEVERLIDENMTYRGMGACHQYWMLKQRFLAERGINWKSPAALNPRVMFD